jgi:hypothetical protein
MSNKFKTVYFEYTRIVGKLEELLRLLIFKDKPKPTCLYII